ncbi:hypothetical protein HDV00_002352 [Rhizophlyctis rosea]|nr:hypothetical protein HDV00_002352 [Rhizophlyctis rosea]
MLSNPTSEPSQPSRDLLISCQTATFSHHTPTRSYFLDVQYIPDPHHPPPPSTSQRTEVISSPTPFFSRGPFRFPLPQQPANPGKHSIWSSSTSDPVYTGEVTVLAFRIDSGPNTSADVATPIGEARINLSKLSHALRGGKRYYESVDFVARDKKEKGKNGSLPAHVEIVLQVVSGEGGSGRTSRTEERKSPVPTKVVTGPSGWGFGRGKDQGVVAPTPEPKAIVPLDSRAKGKDDSRKSERVEKTTKTMPARPPEDVKSAPGPLQHTSTQARPPEHISPPLTRPEPSVKSAPTDTEYHPPEGRIKPLQEHHHRLQIDIHDIWDLPLIKHSSTEEVLPPAVFVKATVGKDPHDDVISASTHVALEGRQATLEHRVTLPLPYPYTTHHPSQNLTLTITDGPTQTTLQRFTLPITPQHFPSHRRTTLLLKSPTVKMRVSVTNIDEDKRDVGDLVPEYSVASVGVEVKVGRVVERGVGVSVRGVVAVRFVEDGEEYVERVGRSQRRFELGLPTPFSTLEPHATLDYDTTGQMVDQKQLNKDLNVPHSIHASNAIHLPTHTTTTKSTNYQMTCASPPQTAPQWNDVFWFCLQAVDLTHRSALIFELYNIHPPVDSAPTDRKIDDLLAYAVVPLQELTTKGVQRNLRLSFVGEHKDTKAALGVWMRSSADMEQMIHNPKQPSIQQSPKPNHLPDFDLRTAIKPQRPSTPAPAAEPSAVRSESHPTSQPILQRDVERRQQLIDRLLTELDVRTEAVKKVGEDLYRLRGAYSDLEQENTHLREKLAASDLHTRKLLNLVEIDVLSHEELKKRYAVLAERLQREVEGNKVLEGRLEEAQEGVIQEDLAQTAPLKSTVEKQEVVIAKLEKLLREAVGDEHAGINAFFHTIHEDPANVDMGVQRMLVEENAMLRERLLEVEDGGMKSNVEKVSNDKKRDRRDETKEKKKAGENIRRDLWTVEETSEYFQTLMRAERAEARVQALEAEVKKLRGSWSGFRGTCRPR